MPIQELSVSGYRSIRQIRLKPRGITVLIGSHGCGRNNLYRVLPLLAKAAAGEFASSIAREGGVSAALWAGPQKRFGKHPEPRRLKFEIKTSRFHWVIECGLSQNASPESAPEATLEELPEAGALRLPVSRFLLDPEFRAESIWVTGPKGGRLLAMDRDGPFTSIRTAGGKMTSYPGPLQPSESALAQLREPHLYPEALSVRAEIAGWRFYDRFRTGEDAPLRHPRPGVLTPVLDPDGAELAAALQTIIEIGEAGTLREEISRALAGARLEVVSEHARLRLLLHRPGVLRPLEAVELSSGALCYLCLAAALLSPRPALLVGLKEPENGIHPDLLPSLARLIVRAARHSQLWISTHSVALAEKIEELSGAPPVRLTMVEGETRIG